VAAGSGAPAGGGGPWLSRPSSRARASRPVYPAAALTRPHVVRRLAGLALLDCPAE
jgi:hypothetical protein